MNFRELKQAIQSHFVKSKLPICRQVMNHHHLMMRQKESKSIMDKNHPYVIFSPKKKKKKKRLAINLSLLSTRWLLLAFITGKMNHSI